MRHFIVFISILMVIAACNRTIKETAVEPNQAEEQPVSEPEKAKAFIFNEDFEDFYDKFHRDSNFQMNRINFPIEGFRITNQGEQISWDKNNWLMHRKKIVHADTSVFEIEIEEKENYRREVLFIEGSGFRTERIFKRKNGKWYLTYFTDENL